MCVCVGGVLYIIYIHTHTHTNEIKIIVINERRSVVCVSPLRFLIIIIINNNDNNNNRYSLLYYAVVHTTVGTSVRLDSSSRTVYAHKHIMYYNNILISHTYIISSHTVAVCASN